MGFPYFRFYFIRHGVPVFRIWFHPAWGSRIPVKSSGHFAPLCVIEIHYSVFSDIQSILIFPTVSSEIRILEIQHNTTRRKGKVQQILEVRQEDPNGYNFSRRLRITYWLPSRERPPRRGHLVNGRGEQDSTKKRSTTHYRATWRWLGDGM